MSQNFADLVTIKETQDLINTYKDMKNKEWEALLRKDMGEYHLKELKPTLDNIKKDFDRIVYHPYLDLRKFMNIEEHIKPLQKVLSTFMNLKHSIIRNKNTNKNNYLINEIENFEYHLKRKLLPTYFHL